MYICTVPCEVVESSNEYVYALYLVYSPQEEKHSLATDFWKSLVEERDVRAGYWSRRLYSTSGHDTVPGTLRKCVRPTRLFFRGEADRCSISEQRATVDHPVDRLLDMAHRMQFPK